jgi:hypothetical protein
MPRLAITSEYTIWCELCSHWEQVPRRNKRVAEEGWRKQGWGCRGKATLCPDCMKQSKTE